MSENEIIAGVIGGLIGLLVTFVFFQGMHNRDILRKMKELQDANTDQQRQIDELKRALEKMKKKE